MKEFPFIVIGSGLSGKTAALELLEKGHEVCMISHDHPLEADSSQLKNGFLFPQSLDEIQQNKYIQDTIRAGDGLIDSSWINHIIENAQVLYEYFNQLNINWSLDKRDKLHFDPSIGSIHGQEINAGLHTSFKISKALNSQLYRFESEHKLKTFFKWKVLSLIKDDNQNIRGVIAQDLKTMEIKPFLSDIIIVATGGMGRLFKTHTQSLHSYSSLLTHLYEEGNPLSNLEFIQYSPAVYEDPNFTIDLAPLALASGARFWTYRDGKMWYFLEDLSHRHQELPTIVISRFIHKIIYDLGLGVKANPYIHLDFSDIKTNSPRLKEFKMWAQKYLHIDPSSQPIPVKPAPIYHLGGLKVTNSFQGKLPGIFCCGEAAHYGHGAMAIESNLLLSSLCSGLQAGKSAWEYRQGKTKLKTLSSTMIESTMYKEHQTNNHILEKNGHENPYHLLTELQSHMSQYLGIVRDNDGLKILDQKIEDIENRAHKINIFDRGKWANQNLFFIRDFLSSLDLAKVMVRSALSRDESRGSHYKPEFNTKDDDLYRKNTVAYYSGIGPRIEYEDLDHA